VQVPAGNPRLLLTGAPDYGSPNDNDNDDDSAASPHNYNTATTADNDSPSADHCGRSIMFATYGRR
jgi:hypothetical protein